MKKQAVRLDDAALGQLIEVLHAKGYTVYGPQRDGPALRWRLIDDASALTAGLDAETSPGRYRMKPSPDGRIFGAGPLPESPKRMIHKPVARLATAEKDNGTFHIIQEKPKAEKIAILGARPCDIAGVGRQDRVLIKDSFADPHYKAQRDNLLLIAANCVRSAETCFCASMETGPRALSGFDIALTERVNGKQEFLAEPGSSAGAEILAELKAPPADAAFAAECHAQCEAAAAGQSRSVEWKKARKLIDRNFDHPRWESAGERCLACGNCTMACPTCFCVNTEERSSPDMNHAERWRTWDSCFTLSFSYIHGGSVRMSAKSRYRQWLTHKLARWQDQFGETGCVGCGRCITWCPVGIDITEEFGALKAGAAGGKE